MHYYDFRGVGVHQRIIEMFLEMLGHEVDRENYTNIIEFFIACYALPIFHHDSKIDIKYRNVIPCKFYFCVSVMLVVVRCLSV